MNRSTSRWWSGVLFILACLVSHAALADTGTVTTVYAFNGGISGPDGGTPTTGVVFGRDGNFYGTTTYGGSGSGSVFKLTPAGTETILLSFDGTNGANPSDLIQGSDGSLYGTTYWGGPNNGYGTVYKITTDGVQTVLYNFTNGGAAGTNPIVGLVEGTDGNFYGTTSGGGSSLGGTAFKITPSGTLTVLHSFAGADGTAPRKLTLGRDGNFYGAAFQGGSGGYGTVFRIAPDGAFNVLYSFTGNPDGALPNGPLLEGSDGNFYGLTQAGGSSANCSFYLAPNCGTVYKITPDGRETVLHSFAGSPNDGALSDCGTCFTSAWGLVEGTDGNFYGITLQGGSYAQQNCSAGCGTLFRITPEGEETVLHSFTGPWDPPNDGWGPSGSLVETSPGVFWGTTQSGVTGWGNVFKYTAPYTGPTVTITANPPTIRPFHSTTLTWSSSNATSCSASGAWSGAKAASGSATLYPPYGTDVYTLTCSGPGGTASASASVVVGPPPPAVTIGAW
ncbi:MAG: hypothetical protein P4L83_05865, partial [Nevskia sp.]|nr:hypothetical protein [Nevskia sp.]